MENLRRRELDNILKELVGSRVHIKYVSSASEENEVAGILEVVDSEVIQIKDVLMGQIIWINRYGCTLSSVRLLEKRKRLKK